MTPHYVPEFDEFCALAAQGNLVPVYREILADLETPVSAFLKVDRGGDAFLLESVEGGEKWARYSFLGGAPDRVLWSKDGVLHDGPPRGPFATRAIDDPLSAVRDILQRYRPVPVRGLPRFAGGFVGYLSYDAVRAFERLPTTARDDLQQPDCYLMLVDTLVVFDNVAMSMKVVSHAAVDGQTDLRRAYDAACGRIDELVDRLQRPAHLPPSVTVDGPPADRKSTRLNSSHVRISYAVFCLKKKKKNKQIQKIEKKKYKQKDIK